MGARVATAITLAVAAGAAIAFVVFVAHSERTVPSRCHPQLVAQGARCCAPGQELHEGHCVGAPLACPEGWDPVHEPVPACVARPRRVRFAPGSVQLGSNDWEALGKVKPRTVRVNGFELDAYEVTYARWAECSARRKCSALFISEPGVPVSDITAEEAGAFCAYAGGRLPTSDEWLYAAMDDSARRFPWGQTGLVCRRASYGLEAGPCSAGAQGPDLAGARPDGASLRGVLDLAGNVAEWTREPDGSFVARGGSFRSRLAAELKTWAFETVKGSRIHVGFRCAYDPKAE
jgi:formylglycine-generating enzyme required for sulfatase activity